MAINKANFAELFRADFNLVQVIFRSYDGKKDSGSNNRAYTYKIAKEKKVEVGEFLLVSVAPIEGAHVNPDYYDLTVVQVVKIDLEPELEGPESIKFKWIVAKLSDVVKEYEENIQKDYRLNKAFATLERKLEQIDLRKKIAMMLEEIGDDDRKELESLFGGELLGNRALSNGGSAGQD